MKIYRYESLDADSLNGLNTLLSHGWTPVREVTGLPADSQPQALVLLEKETASAPFAGDQLIDGTPFEFLAGVMLFENFLMSEIREVVGLCQMTAMTKGTPVFSEGDPAEAMFVVIAGNVEVVLPELPVEDATVVLLQPGGVFGESTFFSETSHSMSATCATESVTLLTLHRAAFEELFQTNSPVALKLVQNVARILAARLQETDQWVWNLLQQSQFARISSSWRRFRHRVGDTESAGGGFFGI